MFEAMWKTLYVCDIRGMMEYGKKNMWKIKIVLQHNRVAL